MLPDLQSGAHMQKGTVFRIFCYISPTSVLHSSSKRALLFRALSRGRYIGFRCSFFLSSILYARFVLQTKCIKHIDVRTHYSLFLSRFFDPTKNFLQLCTVGSVKASVGPLKKLTHFYQKGGVNYYSKFISHEQTSME